MEDFEGISGIFKFVQSRPGLGAHCGVVDDEHQPAVKSFKYHAMSAVVGQERRKLPPGADETSGERIGQGLGVLTILNPAGPKHQEPAGFRPPEKRTVRDEISRRVIRFGLPGLYPGGIGTAKQQNRFADGNGQVLFERNRFNGSIRNLDPFVAIHQPGPAVFDKKGSIQCHFFRRGGRAVCKGLKRAFGAVADKNLCAPHMGCLPAAGAHREPFIAVVKGDEQVIFVFVEMNFRGPGAVGGVGPSVFGNFEDNLGTLPFVEVLAGVSDDTRLTSRQSTCCDGGVEVVGLAFGIGQDEGVVGAKVLQRHFRGNQST